MSRLGASLTLIGLLLLAGCGGGGETSTGTIASAPQGPAAAVQRQATPKQKSAAQRAEPDPGRQHAAEGDPVPGAKAVAPGVPVQKGGDNSIQSFGVEGEQGLREQALADLRSYLSARLAGKWSRACAAVSEQLRGELTKIVKEAHATEKPEGCAATLEALFGGAPKSALRPVLHVGELLSFRIRGHYAYLIYRGAKGKAMFVAMANDGGRWKVNVPQPSPFSETTQGSSQ